MSVVYSTMLTGNGFRPFEDQEANGRGLRVPFSSILGIRIQSEVEILRVVLYDTYQPVVRARVDIRDETGELPIVVARTLLHGGHLWA